MRKTFATFALLFVLSISVFADGDVGLGGRTCPPPEPDQPPPTCTEPRNPINTGTSSTTATGGNSTDDETDESSTLDDVINYLNSLFG